MKQQGMTLIEVMIALAILAIAGLAVMKTSMEQVRHLDSLEEQQLAGWVADNQLAERRLRGVHPQMFPLRGEVTQGERRWRWQIVRMATSDARLMALQVTVSRADSPARPLITLYSWWRMP
ncbi:type II secretion system minor pseudopilin GspI [Pantoea sp. 1.19]|uniref:type II secretion system minor pseudopilin GspI n=1 Tax=Pantoea sp. 1.19 TaxID=1925589 RepID=UPI000948A3C2|nr:type II secretion system minor pseudopilin GspI [Pantoea sp. 1.19]